MTPIPILTNKQNTRDGATFSGATWVETEANDLAGEVDEAS